MQRFQDVDLSKHHFVVEFNFDVRLDILNLVVLLHSVSVQGPNPQISIRETSFIQEKEN